MSASCCSVTGAPPKDAYHDKVSVKNGYVCNLCVGHLQAQSLQINGSLITPNIGASVYSNIASDFPNPISITNYTVQQQNEPIPFNAIDYDPLNLYRFTTNRFKAPVDGLYKFSLIVCFRNTSSSWQLSAGGIIYRNGVEDYLTAKIIRLTDVTIAGFIFADTATIDVYLNAGDEIGPYTSAVFLGGGAPPFSEVVLYGSFLSSPIGHVTVASFAKVA